ncbi:MAG: thiamine pyrophosphate-dependent enzyme [Planctomycetota bacterium]
MSPAYRRPKPLVDATTRYCPGCGHGVAHRLIAEAIEELGIQGRTVGMGPVGCAVFLYDYLDVDCCEAAHGRTPAVACAIKRMRPDAVVFSYQGDGDLAAIGMAETVHTANRGEPISVFFLNNAVYGMTKGQMAPTTLAGQKTYTTPVGRDPATEGHPIRVSELLATLESPAYIERVSLHSPRHILRAKKAVKKAFEVQLSGQGFSFVEMLSPCPTYWYLSPVEAVRWMDEAMLPAFPLGVFRDKTRPRATAEKPAVAESKA